MRRVIVGALLTLAIVGGLSAAIVLDLARDASPLAPRARLTACETACGMHLVAETAGECEELREAETRLLTALKRVRYFAPTAACLQLDGWRIERNPGDGSAVCPKGSFKQEDSPLCFVGMTHLKERYSEVTGSFEHGSFSHEMTHVIFGAGHCGWKARGIKAALRQATGEEDLTPEDCE